MSQIFSIFCYVASGFAFCYLIHFKRIIASYAIAEIRYKINEEGEIDWDYDVYSSCDQRAREAKRFEIINDESEESKNKIIFCFTNVNEKTSISVNKQFFTVYDRWLNKNGRSQHHQGLKR